MMSESITSCSLIILTASIDSSSSSSSSNSSLSPDPSEPSSAGDPSDSSSESSFLVFFFLAEVFVDVALRFGVFLAFLLS